MTDGVVNCVVVETESQENQGKHFSGFVAHFLS